MSDEEGSFCCCVFTFSLIFGISFIVLSSAIDTNVVTTIILLTLCVIAIIIACICLKEISCCIVHLIDDLIYSRMVARMRDDREVNLTHIHPKIVTGTMVTLKDTETCTICFEEMVKGSRAKSLECNHKFHDKCISTWLEQSGTCPNCRCEV